MNSQFNIDYKSPPQLRLAKTKTNTGFQQSHHPQCQQPPKAYLTSSLKLVQPRRIPDTNAHKHLPPHFLS